MIRVLHVDDNPDERDIFCFFVSYLTDSVEVESVSSAQEALDSVKKWRPDCIVSDLDMPGIDGLELLKTLRHAGYQTPFIFLSNHSFDEFADRSAHDSANAFLVKGFGVELYGTLLDKIREIAGADLLLEDERPQDAGHMECRLPVPAA